MPLRSIDRSILRSVNRFVRALSVAAVGLTPRWPRCDACGRQDPAPPISLGPGVSRRHGREVVLLEGVRVSWPKGRRIEGAPDDIGVWPLGGARDSFLACGRCTQRTPSKASLPRTRRGLPDFDRAEQDRRSRSPTTTYVAIDSDACPPHVLPPFRTAVPAAVREAPAGFRSELVRVPEEGIEMGPSSSTSRRDGALANPATEELTVIVPDTRRGHGMRMVSPGFGDRLPIHDAATS